MNFGFGYGAVPDAAPIVNAIYNAGKPPIVLKKSTADNADSTAVSADSTQHTADEG